MAFPFPLMIPILRHSYLLFMLSISLFTISSCKSESKSNNPSCAPTGEKFKGTQEMIDSLAAVYNRTEFKMHPYELDESLIILDSIMRKNPNPSPGDLFNYATELLKGGRFEDASNNYKRLLRTYPATQELNAKNKIIYELLAMSYMRKGEVENCVNNHNGESCILPIQGQGLHVKKEGSQLAIEVYNKILEKFPDDYGSMYLLNIAYNTLGLYPSGVPKKWFVDFDTYKSDYPFPKFKNIASEIGLDNGMTLAGGALTDDFNNDGFIDLITSSWSMNDKLRYYVSNGDGTFTEKTEESGLAGLAGGLNMQQADFNNDGNLDFIILRGAWKLFRKLGIQPNSLIRNNGDGTFTDVTIAAGMYSLNPTLTCRWFDYNNDGWLDCFIGNESLKVGEEFPSEFYVNNGNGTFTNVAAKYGMTLSVCVKGVGAGDINNDGLIDLYLSTMQSPNRLFLNKGGTNIDNWKFEEIAAKAGVTAPKVGFPCMFIDINNDGYEDIFTTSYDSISQRQSYYEFGADLRRKPFTTETAKLYINNKNNTFKEVAEKYGLKHPAQTMGANYGDLDNDGYIDFYLGTGSPDYRSLVPNKMYRNNEGKNFQDVSSQGGFAHIQKGHEISWADFDNDGDQDIYAKLGGAVTGDVSQSALFENPGHKLNKWVVLLLKGTKSNRSAMGAKVKLIVQMQNGSTREIYNTVSTGASFGGNSLQLEIGLGKAKKITGVEIKWPDGKNIWTKYPGVDYAKKYIVTEGTPEFKEVPYKAFKLKPGNIKNVHKHNA